MSCDDKPTTEQPSRQTSPAENQRDRAGSNDPNRTARFFLTRTHHTTPNIQHPTPQPQNPCTQDAHRNIPQRWVAGRRTAPYRTAHHTAPYRTAPPQYKRNLKGRKKRAQRRRLQNHKSQLISQKKENEPEKDNNRGWATPAGFPCPMTPA